MGPSLLLVLALVVGKVSSNCFTNRVVSAKLHTLPLIDAEQKACASDLGVKEKCTFVLRCDPGQQDKGGWYFADDRNGLGIEVVCNNGNWLTTNGSLVPTCQRGCVALDDRYMENATYKLGPPPITYKNGAMKLWPVGTKIETQCKSGYYFERSKTHQAAGYDSHQCTGGDGSGWLDLNTDPNEQGMAWPAWCRGYCGIINNSTLPAGVVVLQDPSANKVADNGKPVLTVGSIYKYKCKDGWKAVNPAYPEGIQTLSCNGNWRDATTGASPASVLQCSANGCPAITTSNIPSNAVVTEGAGCSGDAKADGCTININCKKNDGTGSGKAWYMPNKPNGYALTCNKGTWLDDNGQSVAANSNGVYPGSCEQGCSGLTSNEDSWATVLIPPTAIGNKNRDIIIYPVGSIYTTVCKDGYIRPGMTVQGQISFNCDATGWKVLLDYLQGKNIYPGTCVPACPISESIGTIQNITGAITTKNASSQWVQKGSTLTRVCALNYSPAQGESQPQSLVCEGGSSGWKDPSTTPPRLNVVPLRCTPNGSPGCVEVPLNSGVNFTLIGNCIKVDGLYPKGCIVSIQCQDGLSFEFPNKIAGYYPDGSYTLSETGWQNLSCKAGVEGYQDIVTGTKNTSMLKCQPACRYPESYPAANIVIPASSGDFFPQTYAGSRYVKPGAQVTTTCKPLASGYYWNNEYDKNLVEQAHQTNFLHICMGGPDEYEKDHRKLQVMPGDMCGAICDFLDSSDTTLIQMNQSRINSINFVTNSKKYVVNAEFKVICREGYEFSKGSDEAARGYQRLLCIGGTSTYKDEDTDRINAQPTQCTKAPEPRCPAIDQTTTRTTIIPINSACTQQSGGYAVGCQIQVQCQAGFFPNKGYSGSTSTSKLICKKQSTNIAIWIDLDSQVAVNQLSCTPGCPLVFTNGHSQIIQDSSTVTSGGVTYYLPMSIITIQCLAGYIPRTETEWSVGEGSIGMRYRCEAQNAQFPWRNLKNNALETAPFFVCVKPCDAVVPTEGVDVERSPREINVGGPTAIVSGGGTYVLHCRKGYHYNPARTDNTQTLYCDPDTGTYVDIKSGGQPNMTNAQLAPCIKNADPFCKDLPVQNGQITLSSTCINNAYSIGCKATITCNNNYATTDSRYNITGKQELTCNSNSQWVDSFSNIITQAMICVPVCVYGVNTNAKSSASTLITIVVGSIVYIPAGSEITVTCKGDGVIWIDNVNETNIQHTYKCKGGGNNYTLVGGSGSSAVLPGDGCISTCPVLNINNNPTLIPTVPTAITWNSQQLVSNGGEYSFRCANGYRYPTGGPVRSETFTCNGVTRQFVNKATGSIYVQPTTCIRNPNNDECLRLPYDKLTVEQSASTCLNGITPDTDASGCLRKYRCIDGYRPTVETYNTLNGWQNLTCGLAGRGWADQFGNTVTAVIQCVKGCFNTSYPPGGKPNFIPITYMDYWPVDGTGVQAQCFEAGTFNLTTKPHYYACPITSDYFNSYCDGACRQLLQPWGTGLTLEWPAYQLFLAGVSGSTFIDYVYSNTYYRFKCLPGYSYSPSSPHAAQEYQDLICDAKSHLYTDRQTGAINQTSPEPCVPNQGCTQITKGTNVDNGAVIGTCPPNGARVAENCEMTYTCSQGFYPSDPAYVVTISQNVKCQPGTQSWIITNSIRSGQTTSKTMNCVAGCLNININTITNILKQMGTTVTNSNFVSTNNASAPTLSCFSVQTKTNITNIISQMSNVVPKPNRYVCPDSIDFNSNVKFDDRSSCPPTCNALLISSLTTTNVAKPPIYNPYGTDYVKADTSYIYTCAPGNEFPSLPSGTKPTAQLLTCQRDGSYKNPATGATSTNPVQPSCVQSQPKQCNKPTTENVDTTYDNTCAVGSLVDVSCHMTVSCKNGSYPADKNLLLQRKFDYTCMDGVAGQPPQWRNTSNPTQSYNLQCLPGCTSASDISSSSDSLFFNISYSAQKLSCYNRIDSISSIIPKEVWGYFCELNGATSGINKAATYNCIGGCPLDQPATGITYTLSTTGQFWTTSLPMAIRPIKLNYSLPVVEAPGNAVTFTCPAGRTFVDTKTATRTLTCSPNNVFIENGISVGNIGICS